MAYRAPGISPFDLRDESALERIYGAGKLARLVITESPWGTGLGSANERRLRNAYEDGGVGPFSGMSFADYLAAGGVMGLLVYFVIIGRMLRRPETRTMGCGFAVLTVLWGAPFETFVWWHVALAASMMAPNPRPTARRRALPRPSVSAWRGWPAATAARTIRPPGG